MMNTSTKERKMRADMVPLTEEEMMVHFYNMNVIEEKRFLYARTKHQRKKAEIQFTHDKISYLRENDLHYLNGKLYKVRIGSDD